MDPRRTSRTDEMGGWTHEDWRVGSFQAYWASEVFFLLFNGFLEKLDHLVAPFQVYWASEVFFHLYDGFL